MPEMSYDPAAADNIGSQVMEIAKAGLSAGTQAATSVIGMLPAGADEVSLQAAMSFSQEAIKSLTMNSSALEELMRTGSAFQEIAKMITGVDDGSAGQLAQSAYKNSLGTLGTANLGGSMPSMGELSATAGQLGQMQSAAAPLMQGFNQGMQIGQTIQGATGGMSGGGAPGGGMPGGAPMAPPAQLARDSNVVKRDDEEDTPLTPEGAEAGASAAAGAGTAAPVEPLNRVTLASLREVEQ